MSKGYTPMPNSVYEALYGSNLNSLQLRAVLYLWRTTHGWRQNHKRLESRNIPYGDWERDLNSGKGHISDALKELEKRNIVIRQYQGRGRGYNNYKLNIAVETWRSVPKQVTDSVPESVTDSVPKNGSNCSQNRPKLFPAHEGQPHTINKNIKKDIKKIDNEETNTNRDNELKNDNAAFGFGSDKPSPTAANEPTEDDIPTNGGTPVMAGSPAEDDKRGPRPGGGTTQIAIIAYLREHGASNVKSISQGTGIPEISIRNCLSQNKGLFQTVSRGIYNLVAEGTSPTGIPTPITDEIKRIYAAAREKGITADQAKAYMKDIFHKDSAKELTSLEANQFIEDINAGNLEAYS